MLNKIAVAGRLLYLRGKKPRRVVANACNISVSALAMYESARRIPRDSIKQRLANYYDASVEDIFFK